MADYLFINKWNSQAQYMDAEQKSGISNKDQQQKVNVQTRAEKNVFLNNYSTSCQSNIAGGLSRERDVYISIGK